MGASCEERQINVAAGSRGGWLRGGQDSLTHGNWDGPAVSPNARCLTDGSCPRQRTSSGERGTTGYAGFRFYTQKEGGCSPQSAHPAMGLIPHGRAAAERRSSLVAARLGRRRPRPPTRAPSIRRRCRVGGSASASAGFGYSLKGPRGGISIATSFKCGDPPSLWAVSLALVPGGREPPGAPPPSTRGGRSCGVGGGTRGATAPRCAPPLLGWSDRAFRAISVFSGRFLCFREWSYADCH